MIDVQQLSRQTIFAKKLLCIKLKKNITYIQYYKSNNFDVSH